MADSEQTPLPGTVKYYERHVFVCTGHTEWPGRIEQDGGFIQALADLVAMRAEQMPLKVKLTACDEPPARGKGCDLLVFPDKIRYEGLEAADLADFVDTHLVQGRVAARLHHRPLDSRFIFVCVHGRRDERCGTCGPPLAAQFQAELADKGLQKEVLVRKTSHVGGHAFAGNVLIYPGGDWYGLVSPADVGELVECCLRQGEIVTRLWRGRMGLAVEAQQALIGP